MWSGIEWSPGESCKHGCQLTGWLPEPADAGKPLPGVGPQRTVVEFSLAVETPVTVEVHGLDGEVVAATKPPMKGVSVVAMDAILYVLGNQGPKSESEIVDALRGFLGRDPDYRDALDELLERGKVVSEANEHLQEDIYSLPVATGT
jgi:hypothetical protein